MSKTGIQDQRGVGWAVEYVRRSGCAYWMGIDNFPRLDCRVIGRINWPQGDVDRVVSMGAAGADEVWARAAPIVAANPHVWAWVLVNEASIWDPAVRAGYPAFNRRLTQSLAPARHVACNVNVGHPAAWYWDAGIRAIGEACRGAWALGLHGYSWPNLEDGWHDYVGRYGPIYAALRAKGYAPPPCLMTELGHDKAVADGQHAGWRRVPLTPQGLADQVAAVERRVAADPDVLGTLLFVAGAYEPWLGLGFDIDYDPAMRIADAVAQVEPVPQGRARLVDVSHWQQKSVPWHALRALGYTGAILRLSGPALDPSKPGGVDKSRIVKDEFVDQHYREAMEAGFEMFGGYHYLVRDVDRQAQVCRDAMGDKSFRLPVFCDAEENNLDLARIDRFCTALDTKTGRLTGWYGNWSGYYGWGIESWIGDRALWVARWGLDDCDIPGWDFWQKGYVTVSGQKLDDNEFRGTAAEMEAAYPGGGNGGEPPVGEVVVTPPEVKPWLTLDLDAANKWALEKVEWREGDPPNAFIEVLDLDGNRAVGTQVHWCWSGGESVGTVELKPGDPGGVNWGMTAPAPAFGVFVEDRDRSDYVFGLGLGTPEHPGTNIHCTWVVTFRERQPGPVERHALGIAVSGAGTVMVDPDQEDYAHGSTVTLEAVPGGEGWRFAGWGGDLAGTANPVTLVMDADKAVTASFVEDGPPPGEVAEHALAIRAHADAILVILAAE